MKFLKTAMSKIQALAKSYLENVAHCNGTDSEISLIL